MTGIEQRTDLVIPAAAVAGLQIPPLAVTDGTADPVWVDVPLYRRRIKPPPTQRLPFDPRSARVVRRYFWLAPWSALLAVILIAVWLSSAFTDRLLSGGYAVVVSAISFLSYLVQYRGLPASCRSAPASATCASPRFPKRSPRSGWTGTRR
ncbi:hypothetical protein [Paractinoplanes durhamensis]|uniref:hypothetical protein n=1 Tax=Paractinoplanes durhamensis TaxID=113563 RepID=UPI0036324559